MTEKPQRPPIERNDTRIRFNFRDGGVFVVERNRGQSAFDRNADQFLVLDALSGEGVYLDLGEARALASWLAAQCGPEEVARS